MPEKEQILNTNLAEKKKSPIYGRQLRPILLALFAATIPHVNNLHLWVIFWCLGLWGFIWRASGKARPVLNTYFTAFLAIAGFGGALLSFGGALHTDAYVALLSVMAGLKPLESRCYRDYMISLFLAYFMVITNLFYSDELGMTLYMFGSVLLTTAVLIHLQHPAGSVKQKFRLASVIMLQAIPVMLILFFLFPRIQGNILGIAQRTGRSGFSDKMSPGRLSSLAQNDAIAFRVTFEGPVPPQDQLYWRGIVFTLFDGREWTRGIRLPASSSLLRAENPVNYTLTLEPHNDRWLFALDMPGTKPAGGYMLSDFTLMAHRPVGERKLYQMTSYTSYDTGPMEKWERRVAELPPGSNPRSAAMAQTWAASGMGPEEIVKTALRHFREKGFVYTLEPPLLGTQPVDDFLFETRRGYCEHYASAFVFLMRAAGIPARVVAGYQGGEINPYGGYLIVRQAHAHAWAEVWFSGKGWTRTDPTAVVAPERVEGRLEDALSANDLFRFFSMPKTGWMGSLLTNMRFGWDMVNAYWNLWIMAYSLQDQTGLLAKLGIRVEGGKWILKTALLITGLIAVVFFLFFLRMRHKAAPKRDPVRDVYAEFCRKLERKGVPRRPEMGPADYAKTAMAALPDLKKEISDITGLYIRMRYGEEGNREMLRQFRSQVRDLRI
ncbi:MAG: DUF3488 and transglutaminase-like domain-containing protein [Desulfobacterales bacterium]